MSKPITCSYICTTLNTHTHRYTHSSDIRLKMFVWHWNCCVGICQHLPDQCKCFFRLQLESVTTQTAGMLIHHAFLHERGSCCKKKFTACAQNNWQCVCDCVFQVGPQGGCPLTATAAARATKASVRGRAALPSTSSPRPVLRPSRRPAPLKEPWSVAPWAGGPMSRRWTAPCLKDRFICCSRRRCAVRLRCSVWEPSGSAKERLQRGKQTRRRWLQSRSWRNASRTSAALGFPITFRRGSTCGNQSSWESIVSKNEWEQEEREGEMAVSWHQWWVLTA